MPSICELHCICCHTVSQKLLHIDHEAKPHEAKLASLALRVQCAVGGSYSKVSVAGVAQKAASPNAGFMVDMQLAAERTAKVDQGCTLRWCQQRHQLRSLVRALPASSSLAVTQPCPSDHHLKYKVALHSACGYGVVDACVARNCCLVA